MYLLLILYNISIQIKLKKSNMFLNGYNAFIVLINVIGKIS